MRRNLLIFLLCVAIGWAVYIHYDAKSKAAPRSLYDACVDGNMEAARDFLERDDTDVNAGNKKGVSPLHIAVVLKKPPLVKLLLEHGADVNAKTKTGWTPLMDASHNGHFQCVKILLEHGADAEVKGLSGWSPLIRLIRKGKPGKEWLETMELLIQKGADVNYKSKKKWTPLMHLCRYLEPGEFRFRAANLLIKNGADVNIRNKGDWIALMHLFYKGGTGENAPQLTQLFIDNGLNVNVVNEVGWTPIMYALRYGENNGATLKTIRILIDNGADVTVQSAKNWTPLMAIAKNENRGKEKTAIMKLLLEKGAEVNNLNYNGRIALFYPPDADTVSLLLEHGAKIDLKSRRQQTPLMYAISKGRVEAAKCLIEKGAGVNAKDKKGRTPLILAAKYDHFELVPLLLKKGANAVSKTWDRRTALFHAAKNGSASILDLLVKKGAKVNIQTTFNDWTPLAYACRWGNVEGARALLKNGADASLRTDPGWTPMMYAVHGGFKPIVKLLKQHNVPYDADYKELKENAAPYYLRGVRRGVGAGYKTIDKIDEMIEKGWKKDEDVEDYLQYSSESFKLIQAGLNKERCDFGFSGDYDFHTLFRVVHRYKIEIVTRLFLLKGKQLEAQRKPMEAVELYVSYLRFLTHIAGSPVKNIQKYCIEPARKVLAAVGNYLGSRNASRTVTGKYAKLRTGIKAGLELYEKNLFPAVSLVRSHKEDLLKRMQSIGKYITKYKLGSKAPDPDREPDKALYYYSRAVLQRVVGVIINVEGKQLTDHYYGLYEKAALSSKDEDWLAAAAEVEKLAKTLPRDKKGKFINPITDELAAKYSKEKFKEAISQFTKILLVKNLTNRFKKSMERNHDNLETLKKLKARL